MKADNTRWSRSPKFGLSSLPLVAVVLLLLLSGCPSSEQRTGEPVPEAEHSSRESDEVTLAPSAQARDVRFAVADGTELEGRLFGNGEKGAILAHMFPDDQSSWFEFAQELADQGYTALAFNFRGYGGSGGSKEITKIDSDLEGALDFLEDNGARSVVLIGASMGGTASLKVAARREVMGVVSVSGPKEFRGLEITAAEVGEIESPKLFIVASEDQPNADEAQELLSYAAEPKEIKVFSGQEHGTEFLTSGRNTEFSSLLLRFLGELERQP